MTNSKETTSTEVKISTFAQQARAFSPQKVAAMVKQIANEVEIRSNFIAYNNIDKGITDGSKRDFTDIQRHLKGSENNLARVLLMCGVKAATIFNRERTSGQRANLKGIVKVIQMSNMLVNSYNQTSVQMVTRAYIACAIHATANGKDWLSSDDQENILSSATISPTSMNAEIQKVIADHRHKSMSKNGGAATQSSQMRTILDNLNGLTYETRDGVRGVKINLDSAVVQQFARLYNVELPVTVCDNV